jgi:tetratricopeptide (TPR) repeat protein
MHRFILTFACLLLFQTVHADCNDDAEQLRVNGQIEESIDRLTECINSELGHVAKTYYQLGLANYERGAYDTAIEDYSHAIDVEPDYALAHAGRGLTHASRNDFDAALVDLSRAIELDNSNAEAYYQRATIYRKQRLDHLAIKDYNRALEIEPGLARAHMGKGFTYLTPLIPVLLVLLLG